MVRSAADTAEGLEWYPATWLQILPRHWECVAVGFVNSPQLLIKSCDEPHKGSTDICWWIQGEYGDGRESVSLRELYIIGREEPVTSWLTYIYCNDTDRLRFTYWVWAPSTRSLDGTVPQILGQIDLRCSLILLRLQYYVNTILLGYKEPFPADLFRICS